MTSTIEAAKAARLYQDPYLDWIEREGIHVVEGLGFDLHTVETKPWPRFGVNGVAIHLTGRGDWASCYAIDIPPGASTTPQRHLYEEVMYVAEGRGSTEIELPNGKTHSFEWQEHSMFAIPLNVRYRLHNGDGKKRAVVASVHGLPLTMKIYHDDEFIFENKHFFKDRIGKDDWFTGAGDLSLVRAGQNMWETNFVPDLSAIELTAWSERGAGSMNLMFLLANGNMHAHTSEIATGTYKKAHFHEAGAHIFTVSGKGYSLLWTEGEQDFIRVDWYPGMIFAPVDRQFHQHFTTSQTPSRYLALIGGGNARYPLTQKKRDYSTAKDGGQGTIAKSTKDGGSQVEYEDQDPRIHEIWLEEMRKNGITPQFEKFGGPQPKQAVAAR
jgi:mannose-6-phosphate isomerase-like protein (cupin superfamily)